MITTYIDELLGEGFCSSEFGIMVAGVIVIALAFILVKTLVGWIKEIV